MSQSQVPLRSSQRTTQGKPPVRFESYSHNMPMSRSPTNKDTTSASGTASLNVADNNMPKGLTPSLENMTAANNELSEYRREFRKQMEQMQKQMLLMQTQFLNNAKEMKEHMVSNNEKIRDDMRQLRQEIEGTRSMPQTSASQPQSNNRNQSLSSVTPPSVDPLLPQSLSQVAPLLSMPSSQLNTNPTTSTYNYSMPQKKIYPLPPFSGLPEEWQTFSEAFTTTTNEFMYNDLHNIMRLREAVKGRARDVVECLLANSANVEAIITTLRETFGRPEQLIKSQIEKVRQIPPLINDNLESLVEFANKITNMATFLKNVQGEHHLSNPSLLSELVAKLPINRQLQWGEKCLLLEKVPTIVNFSEWLETLRRIANIVHDTLPSIPTTSKSRKFACVAVNNCPVCHGVCNSVSNCKQYLKMSIEERWSKIKQIKACFCCLKKGHQLNQCRQKRRCGKHSCQKFHHILLHHSNIAASENCTRNPNSAMEPQLENRNCHAVAEADVMLFQIVPVRLYGKNKIISTYAFVDDGANVSMLDSQIAKELELHGKQEILSLQWLNKQCVSQNSENVNLIISGIGEADKRYTINNVYTTSDLSLPIQSCHLGNLIKDNNSVDVTKFKFRNYSNVQPRLIISLYHCFLTVPLEVPRFLSATGPIVITTRLGTIVYGAVTGKRSITSKRVLHVRVDAPSNTEKYTLLQKMNDTMRSYFELETIGIKPNIKQLMATDEERALSILKETTKKVDGRYECRLLWRENVPQFPDTYNMALGRLYNIERKMAGDLEYAKEYRQKINEYLAKGYARKLNEAECATKSKRTFYLPHFGVKNLNKKGIRIVFDAAAEVQNVSLNKNLLSGPDVNNSLISILMKFRESPIAVCGDIKEMFHQIKIAKGDQDSQRFLWRDGDANKEVETYVMQRMIFGATCAPAVAQFVKNFNANKYKEEFPRAVYGIISRHYVDDYVDCFQNDDEAIKVLNEVIRIHKEGGFELRNITSNSELVIKSCERSARGSSENGEFLNKNNIERILGIHWLPEPDVFCFLLKFDKINKSILKFSKIPTKREMLSLNMSIYDPFGFLCDLMITSKVLMQRVWKTGIEWDERLPEDIYCQWKMWVEELAKVQKYRIPRCYCKDFLNCEVELHIFVDASEEAMATVAYWRVVGKNGINIIFVMGKTACAPTRYQTIPKLELQAAVMGVRMREIIIDCHVKTINKTLFWTDSHTVIRWIRSDHRKYKQYVANRVSEILDSSQIDNWRWCPGVQNPADAATRAKFPVRYEPNGQWTKGPEFLYLDESQWPTEAQMGICADNSKTELRSKHMLLVARQMHSEIPHINRFSKFSRLKRAMAWVRRYVINLLFRTKHMKVMQGELTIEEEAWAESYLCRQVQQEMFGDELADLRLRSFVSKTSSIKALNPVMGADGLMRASGRLQNASYLSIETKNPIILPTKHRFTYLLAESYHVKLRHINLATVMNEIRLRFWIPSLRRLLNSIQARCQFCRIRRAKPYQPQMAPLPIERVTPYVRPFTYTGIDYFGPVLVSVRRQREKRWVALFTCLSIRAIHLEIAKDLSTDSCLLAIRNFINRRGVPLVIRSDNGTNFVGIEKELQGVSKFMDNNAMTSSLTALGIKWIFNTPANPAEGGVWERLVQSVKRALNIMLREQAPRVETLQSFLIEAENMINARPLTHLAVTPEDPEPLTPNHFILGCANSTHTPAPYEARLMCLRKQWRIVQNLKNGMWHRWIREYLPELTRRTKWCLPSQPIGVGCLVFICDSDMPRSQWKRGRIIELYTGKDSVTRSAKVSTSSGTYRRPISKLAILDVMVETMASETSPSGSVHAGGDVGDGNTEMGNSAEFAEQ